MKLSMWMIANRLAELNPELHIRDDAPVVLTSARQAYATNCVYVYAENDYVICNGEGDYIKLYDITLAQAFELVQSVFDYFEDWVEGILLNVHKKDYQEVMNLAWQVFQNPIVLLDGNRKVLGLSRQYGANDFDEEWNYISTYGYSSLNAIKALKFQYGNLNFRKHGFQSYSFDETSTLHSSGVSYCMYSDDIYCGRINLFAKERELNRGDYQLLEKLAQLLEPRLGQAFLKGSLHDANVFFNLLMGNSYSEKMLDVQLNYQQWDREDTYYLVVVELRSLPGHISYTNTLDVLLHLISRHLSNCVVLKKSPYVMILSNRDLTDNAGSRHFLNNLMENNPVRIGFSLPCCGIEHVGKQYHQAVSAIYYGSMNPDRKPHYHFFDYAIDYIVDSDSLEKSVSACMPGVIELWNMYRTSGDEMFHTLKCYLENNNSLSKTSIELFTHRNTILYRIKKIKEILQCDLDEVYNRDYCRISIWTLELYDRKQKEKPQ